MKTAEDVKDAKRFFLLALEQQSQAPGKRDQPAKHYEQKQR